MMSIGLPIEETLDFNYQVFAEDIQTDRREPLAGGTFRNAR